MRKIRRIVLHNTAGWPDQSTKSILDWWRTGLGWKNVGYHKLINVDGTIEDLAPLSQVTNGVSGYNSDSVHICYKGGLVAKDKGKDIYGDTRTPEQKMAFYTAIRDVLSELRLYQAIDDITIVGHRDLSPDKDGSGKIEQREWIKVCPSFNAIDEYGWICGRRGLERLKHRKTY